MTQNKTTLTDSDLRKIGFDRIMSKVLICLSEPNEKSPSEIETATGLRQPEVSIALKSLQADEFVTFREVKKHAGKGRPVKYFKLEVPVSAIVSKRVDAIQIEAESMLQTSLKVLETSRAMELQA
jgi:predicted transcriptional regulator